jgi:hypothetical protein
MHPSFGESGFAEPDLPSLIARVSSRVAGQLGEEDFVTLVLAESACRAPAAGQLQASRVLAEAVQRSREPRRPAPARRCASVCIASPFDHLSCASSPSAIAHAPHPRPLQNYAAQHLHQPTAYALAITLDREPPSYARPAIVRGQQCRGMRSETAVRRESGSSCDRTSQRGKRLRSSTGV